MEFRQSAFARDLVQRRASSAMILDHLPRPLQPAEDQAAGRRSSWPGSSRLFADAIVEVVASSPSSDEQLLLKPFGRHAHRSRRGRATVEACGARQVTGERQCRPGLAARTGCRLAAGRKSSLRAAASASLASASEKKTQNDSVSRRSRNSSSYGWPGQQQQDLVAVADGGGRDRPRSRRRRSGIHFRENAPVRAYDCDSSSKAVQDRDPRSGSTPDRTSAPDDLLSGPSVCWRR